MLNAVIINSSLWMAPVVFVQKKSGEIQLCVDYRELNNKTMKVAYPLPQPNEGQGQLAGSTMFSTLDLQCGYWQLPVHPSNRAQRTFSPGPSMGLYEFTCMPFGLCGVPSYFQRLMDKICRGLPSSSSTLMMYLSTQLPCSNISFTVGRFSNSCMQPASHFVAESTT